MDVVYFAKGTEPMYSYQNHCHPTWEIVLHLSGEVVTTVDGKTHHVKSGDLLIFPPNTYHSGESESGFTDMPIGIDYMDFPKFTMVQDTDGRIRTLMFMLYDILSSESADDSLLVNSILEAICSCVRHYIKENKRYEFVTQLQEVIHGNLDNPDFSLPETIKKMGFCADYLRRCFKQDTGMTPLEYLTQQRIRLAKNLLMQGSFESISATARQCGFRDPFYFATCFKKHTSLTPSQYRSIHFHT